MNNYILSTIGMTGKCMAGRAMKAVKEAAKKRTGASAVIGEVLVMIVVVAMAAIFKSGGLKFIQEIWTTMTTTASTMFS